MMNVKGSIVIRIILSILNLIELVKLILRNKVSHFKTNK